MYKEPVRLRLTEFGKCIRKLRIDAEITLNDMAAAIGFSPSFVSSVETGCKKISKAYLDTLIPYLKSLGVDTSGVERAARVSSDKVSLVGLSVKDREKVIDLIDRLRKESHD